MEKRKLKFLPSTSMNHSITKIDKGLDILYNINYSDLEKEELKELYENIDGYLDVLEQIKIDVQMVVGEPESKNLLDNDLDVENKNGIIIY